MSKEIGKRLKEFVNKSFKTQSEFTRAMGKSPAFFTPYFNGNSVPGGEILKKLAEFGCDINWLLTGQVTEPPAGSGNYSGNIVTQTGQSGHQIAGNLSGDSVKIKGPSAETPQGDKMANFYEKLIQQKDQMIERLNSILTNQDEELKRLNKTIESMLEEKKQQTKK
jgi:transcriptional regulator with XRE-family HTH domain